MLKSQTIQMTQSKRREKMAGIQKADEITDEGRTELRSLCQEYEDGETELRASLLIEGAEREQIKEPDRAANEFETECRAFDLTTVIAAQVDGKLLSGREAEVTCLTRTCLQPSNTHGSTRTLKKSLLQSASLSEER